MNTGHANDEDKYFHVIQFIFHVICFQIKLTAIMLLNLP